MRSKQVESGLRLGEERQAPCPGEVNKEVHTSCMGEEIHPRDLAPSPPELTPEEEMVQDVKNDAREPESVPLERQGRPTKLACLQQRLAAAEGASLPDLVHAFGWQAHTVRAALTRLRQAGHRLERSRSAEGQTVYWIRPHELTRDEITRPDASAEEQVGNSEEETSS